VGRFRTSDVTEREVSQLISKGVTTHQRAEEGR
jgi:hypothetical protein